MDTREAKVQLPSYLIGDLSPKEAAIIEGHLDVNPEAKAAKESMARQLLPVINLPAPEVGETALNKLFADARGELEQPQYQSMTSWREGLNIAVRVAAVLLVAAVLGIAIHGVIPSSPVIGELRTSDGHFQALRENDVVKTSQGMPVTFILKSTNTSVAMDGSAAVKITREGEESVLEVLRGRVIVSAGDKTQLVVCGADGEISIESRAVAAIDYDTPYNGSRGAVVELQRQTISDVAREAERRYGGLIETTGLNESVSKRRISLYGVGLRKEEFIAAFKSAAGKYGVAFKPDGKNFKLVYEGSAGNAADESESVLKVAPLDGILTYKHNEDSHKLHAQLSEALVLLNGEAKVHSAADDGDGIAQRMVVWAGRTDLPHFRLADTVSNYIADNTRKGGRVVVVAAALPAGTVITGDSLRLGGVLIKVGEPIKLDLPGSPSGTLLGVMSSGIEVAKGDSEGTRYFVPVSGTR